MRCFCRRIGFGVTGFLVKDWDFINGYSVRDTQQTIYQDIPKSLLNCFDEVYHQDWIDDGISIEVMKNNNIKYCVKDHQIIIPHYYGLDGRLIGIRCRNLVEETVEKGSKYMPVYLPLCINLCITVTPGVPWDFLQGTPG